MAGWRLSDDSGGLLWDTMVHSAYLIEHFLGPITSTYAAARRVKERVPDSFTVILQNEKVGSAEFVWNAKKPFLELQLIGEDGQCFHADLVHDCILSWSRDLIDGRKYALGLVVNDIRVPIMRWSRYLRNFWEIRSHPGALPFQKTFFVLIGQLVSFLNGERHQPPVSPEQGLRAIRVLEALRKSIASGKTQNVRT
jgi:predicted dehydrogenase